MKIVWLTHRDPLGPQAGGAETGMVEIGAWLVTRGHDVTILAGQRPNPSTPRSEHRGVRLLYSVSTPGPHFDVGPVLRAIRPDAVVHDLAHVVPWGFRPSTSAPVVVYFRHLHARTLPGQVSPAMARLLMWVERAYPTIYPNTRFVTESNSGVHDLVRLGIASSRITQIPPGVDTNGFRPGPKTPSLQLVYFGGLREYKRPEHAIAVLSELVRTGVPAELVVLGDGPALARLKRVASDMELGSRIRFLGRVDRTSLAEIVSRSWVNLHTSVAEGWGYSVLEASAAGTPTAGYLVPGVIESVKPAMSGLLVKDGDVTALAAAVVEISKDETRWRTTSREWAARFDWDTTAASWEQLLLRLGTD